MIIGIDVDNTITNTLPTLKKYCKKFNDEVVKRNLKMNETGYNTSNIYDWTEEENRQFCKKYIEQAHTEATIKENAPNIIQRLKKDGNLIYIISARHKPYFSDPYSLTKNYLDINGIVYDELVVDCIDKLTFCKEHNIDILVDDEPQNIQSVSSHIPVIVFEGPQNSHCQGNNIIKVNDWNSVYELINKYKFTNTFN